MLRWDNSVFTNSGLCIGWLQNMRLKHLLTPTGCRSLWYHSLYRRVGHPKVKDATAGELRSLSLHLKYPSLTVPLQTCVALNGISIEPALAYPTSDSIISMTQTKSSLFRKLRLDEASSMCCLYKIGLVLTPGEVKNWTKRLKRITSVRHRSLLLRIAHGDAIIVTVT